MSYDVWLSYWNSNNKYTVRCVTSSVWYVETKIQMELQFPCIADVLHRKLSVKTLPYNTVAVSKSSIIDQL